MAITTLATPQLITPAYNPMYFYFDSTAKANLGFRYIVTVINNTTSEVVGTYRLKPIPTTLYGEVDISELIQQELTPDFRQLSHYVADNHQLSYRLTIDEEYYVSLAFTDYGFAGAATWASFANPSVNPNGFTRTMLSQTTVPTYSAGDVILVAQTPGANFRPELEGVHTVLDVFLSAGVYYTVLDLLWIGSGGTSAGVSSYADGQKTTVTGTTVATKLAYKGAFPFMSFKDYDYSQLTLTGVGKLLMTSLQEGVRISRIMPTWLSGYVNNAADKYIVFTIAGVEYRYDISTYSDEIILFNALPSDATIEETYSGGWIPFVGSIDLSTVTDYTVQAQRNDGTPLSKTYTISLYSECDKFTTYDICFLDRQGSWITIPFNKGSYMTQSVQREDIRKKYGGYSGGEWVYNATDTGSETYSVEETISYTVNTGILSELECQFMRELLSTPQAYVSIDGGEFQAIKITSASMPLHLHRTMRDRKVNLVFTMSVQDEING